MTLAIAKWYFAVMADEQGITGNKLRPYGRKVLYGNNAAEILVAKWKPGVECAPHDHGGEKGEVYIIPAAHERDIVDAHGNVLIAHGYVTTHNFSRPPSMLVFNPNDQSVAVMKDGKGGAWLPAGVETKAFSLENLPHFQGLWERGGKGKG